MELEAPTPSWASWWPRMSISINIGNERVSRAITRCRISVRAMIRGAFIYPRKIALAPPTPTILDGDVITFSIGGGLIIESKVRMPIIEKVAPVSMKAGFITESQCTMSVRSWGAPRLTEDFALIIDDDMFNCCVTLLGCGRSFVC